MSFLHSSTFLKNGFYSKHTPGLMVNTLENEHSLGVTCVRIVDALCLASIQPFLNLVFYSTRL